MECVCGGRCGGGGGEGECGKWVQAREGMRMYEGDSSQFKVPVSAVLHQKREDMVVFLASMGGVEFCQLTKYGSPEV